MDLESNNSQSTVTDGVAIIPPYSVREDVNYFGNFPPEAIEVAAQLWTTSIPSPKFYRLIWKLRKILVQNEVMRDLLYGNEAYNFFFNQSAENPNLFRPLFRGIAEGLSKQRETSEYGLGKLSDYELYHNLRNNDDYERYSEMLEIDISVLRQRWVNIRAAIKRKQESVINFIIVRGTTWINMLILWLSGMSILIYIFVELFHHADNHMEHSLNQEDDQDKRILTFIYRVGATMVITTFLIHVYGSYRVYYVRDMHQMFFKEVKYFCLRYILAIVILMIPIFYKRYMA